MELTEFLRVATDYGIAGSVSLVVIYFGIQIAKIIVTMVREKLLNREKKEEITGKIYKHHFRDDESDSKLKAEDSGKHKTIDIKHASNNLTHHYFFINAEVIITSKISSLVCGCEARTKLFQDMSRIMCECWRNSMIEFVEEAFSPDSPRQHNYEFGGRIAGAFLDSQQHMKRRWEEHSMPSIAIEVFTEWAQKRFDVIHADTILIGSSEYYHNNYERMACVLSAHEIALQILIMSMNRIIFEMNGKLDNIVYKDNKIVPINEIVNFEIENEKLRAEHNSKLKKLQSGEWSEDGKYRKPIRPV